MSSYFLNEIAVEGTVQALAEAWVLIESFDWPIGSTPSFEERARDGFSASFRGDVDDGMRARLSVMLSDVSANGAKVRWLSSSCVTRMSSRLDRFEEGQLVSSTTAPWYFSRGRDMEDSVNAAMGDIEALRRLIDRAVSSTETLSDERESVAEYLSLASCVAKAAEDGGRSLLAPSEEELLLLADGVQEIRDESKVVDDDYPRRLLLILERLVVLRRIEAARI